MSDHLQATMLNGTALAPLNLVLITGMSGAGKSVALRALEDTGYFCVDNLPPELIVELLHTLQNQPQRRKHVAIAVDGRSANSLPLLPEILKKLGEARTQVKLIYLDATDDALIRRFSETRRRHPLSLNTQDDRAAEHEVLQQAIHKERELLADLKMQGVGIDTSLLRSGQLQSWVKTIVEAPQTTITLVFESFAFKRGIPLDADFVFDVRMLPNPHYVTELRTLTGKDLPIQQWLRQYDDVKRMLTQLQAFLSEWIPAFVKDHRSYLTVAIGCTGGQHRSVFMVEQLNQYFSKDWNCIARHREQDIC